MANENIRHLPNRKVDVAIIGGGVTGLTIAKKLDDLGLSCTLIEKRNELASGASTRNEGWLHAGTYHAASIVNPYDAEAVVDRCRYGYNQILGYAPEAVEELTSRSFAFIKDPSKVDFIVSRWEDFGISHNRRRKEQIQSVIPGLKTDSFSEGYIVEDKAINTRLLYSKLATSLGRSPDSTIYTGCQAEIPESNIIKLSGQSTDIIEAKQVVLATGYGSEELIDQMGLSKRYPIRYWKSHLMVVPRVSPHGFFFIEPGEVTVMNHGNKSIIGTNVDGIFVSKPDTSVVPSKQEEMINAFGRAFETPKNLSYLATACIKIDITQDKNSIPSLNPFILELRKDHLWVLPGKMTETPYVADQAVQQIFRNLNSGTSVKISQRPMDTWEQPQTEEDLSKAN